MTLSPRCEKCNHSLELTQSILDTKTDELRLYISPCVKCLELERKEGVCEGIAQSLETMKRPVEA